MIKHSNPLVCGGAIPTQTTTEVLRKMNKYICCVRVYTKDCIHMRLRSLTIISVILSLVNMHDLHTHFRTVFVPTDMT